MFLSKSEQALVSFIYWDSSTLTQDSKKYTLISNVLRQFNNNLNIDNILKCHQRHSHTEFREELWSLFIQKVVTEERMNM